MATDINSLQSEFYSFYCLKPRYEKIIDAVCRLIKYRHTENSAMLIVGPSGVGKTEIAIQCQQQIVTQSTKTHSRKDVLLIEFGNEQGAKGLYEKLLYALGDTNPVKGSIPSMERRSISLINNLDVKVIFFDEAHGILPNSKLINNSVAKKFLKGLINRTNASYVLLGLPECELLLNDEELNTRFDPTQYLNEFSCLGEDNTLDFIDYLLDLTIDFPCDLVYLDCLKQSIEGEDIVISVDINYVPLYRFCLATHGNPRLISKFFSGIIELSEKNSIATKAVFEQIWELKLHRKGYENPFTMTQKRLIDQLKRECLYV